MTIQDWFEKNFAKGMERIHDPSNLGSEKMTEGTLPWFLSSETEDRGALFVYCGGEALIGFSLPLHSLPKEPRAAMVYLVRDDAELKRWEWERQDNPSGSKGPCPRARLTLVMTA